MGNNADQATDLYLQVHRARWLESGAFADEGAKMSVALNGGAFYDAVGEKFALPYSQWGVNDGSVRGDIFAATPASVNCVPADAQFGGCLVGAYHTTRFSIPLPRLGKLVAGSNTLSFRFNGTNGVEMGFRVLKIDILGGGQSVLAPNQFVQDDPKTWTPPLNDAANIAAGKALFQTAALIESPINPTHQLVAHCTSCHANDGRDLAYFNFSNKSIIYRSEFHGLTQKQGEQIASYIRAVGQQLNIPAGYTLSDLGRPWNPPYQPGPGLDAKPQMLWSAGAGLDAVLDSDAQMRDYLFSGKTTSFLPAGNPKATPVVQNINGYFGYANPRELPEAIQFPDWMMWLPRVAPEDRTSHPADWFSSPLYTSYVNLRDTILPNPTQKAALIQSHYFLLLSTFNQAQATDNNGTPVFDLVPGQGADYKATAAQMASNPSYYRQQGLLHADGYMSGVQWMSLRQWELFNTHGLEETESIPFLFFPGTPINQRAWPLQTRSMFHLAPHFSGPAPAAYPGKQNNYPFSFLFSPVGNYLTTAWYTLQMVVNEGYQSGAGQEWPLDWNYQLNFIPRSPAFGSHYPNQPYRYFASVELFTQSQQYGILNTASSNWIFPFRHIFDGLSVAMSDSLTPAQSVEVTNQSIVTVMELLESYPINDPTNLIYGANVNPFGSTTDPTGTSGPNDTIYGGFWPRKLPDKVTGGIGVPQPGSLTPYSNSCTKGAQVDHCFEPANYVVDPNHFDAQDDGFYGRRANQFYNSIVAAVATGVPGATIARMKTWAKKVWPATNWDAITTPP